MKKLLALLVGCALSGGAIAASSDDGMSGSAGAPSFESLDRNKDGVLSRTEAKSINKQFSSLDTDNDGRLSRTEFQAAVGADATSDQSGAGSSSPGSGSQGGSGTGGSGTGGTGTGGGGGGGQ